MNFLESASRPFRFGVCPSCCNFLIEVTEIGRVAVSRGMRIIELSPAKSPKASVIVCGQGQEVATSSSHLSPFRASHRRSHAIEARLALSSSKQPSYKHPSTFCWLEEGRHPTCASQTSELGIQRRCTGRCADSRGANISVAAGSLDCVVSSGRGQRHCGAHHRPGSVRLFWPAIYH